MQSAIFFLLHATQNIIFLRKTLFYNQFRTLYKTAVTYSAPVTFDQFKNQKKFSDVQSEVMRSLMDSPRLKEQLPDVKNWISRLLDYTLEGGKRSRGLVVPFAYEMLEDPKHFTEENLHRARILGWVVEIIESYVLMVDDIVDSSQTRRGKECWHIHSGVGLGAVNDCGLLLACAFELLELYFGKEKKYGDLVKITNGTVFQICIGQHIDCLYGYSKEKNNFDKLTKEHFDNFTLLKAAVYSFKLPMLLALTLVKDRSTTFSEEAYNIDWNIGRLLQLQNDYKDIFVDDIKTGKVGTDIQEGKLTWFAVTALQRCTEGQRAIFKENYGSKNPEHVKRIKQLFDELEMEKLYKVYERSVYEDLVRRIRSLPTRVESQFLAQILKGCYKHFC
ncbi:farnesyl pyrophosphate synthase 2-like [Spodoptera litura]|uniref:Farnesyl pyrophosphate synthase n=1 Tax=Spodoptera litura TaxID=69820 RepID=A0A9J7EU47_SPOLT|nr:farnesyl pyrophosphate synthase 2-like [Spodoptera litura]